MRMPKPPDYCPLFLKSNKCRFLSGAWYGDAIHFALPTKKPVKNNPNRFCYLVLPDQGSNLNSSEPKSDVLPITPSGRLNIKCERKIIVFLLPHKYFGDYFSALCLAQAAPLFVFSETVCESIIYLHPQDYAKYSLNNPLSVFRTDDQINCLI